VFGLTGIGKSLGFTTGIRFDDYTDISSTVNPRVGLVYTPNHMTYFKTLFGTAFRVPDFRELYLENSIIQNGNPDLEPEKLETIEGLIGFIAEYVTGSLTYYHTKIENLIQLVEDPEHLASKSANIGILKANGIEGELKVLYDEQIYGYFNVTYQRVKNITHLSIQDKGGTTYTQNAYDIGNIPEIIMNLGFNTQVGSWVNLNVSLNYKGKRERSGELKFTSDSDDPDGTLVRVDQRDPIKERTIVNASIIIKDFNSNDGWEFQITGYNLFDADDRSPEPEGTILNDIPRWGTHFLGKVTYSF